MLAEIARQRLRYEDFRLRIGSASGWPVTTLQKPPGYVNESPSQSTRMPHLGYVALNYLFSRRCGVSLGATVQVEHRALTKEFCV